MLKGDPSRGIGDGLGERTFANTRFFLKVEREGFDKEFVGAKGAENREHEDRSREEHEQEDHVTSCAEEDVVAIIIREIGSQYRALLPECTRSLSHPIFYGDF